MNDFCVYKHISPNGKIYIGQTCQTTKKRWRHDGTGYKGQRFFYNAILKYGWNNFEHIIMADNITQGEANWLEKYLVRFYQSDKREFGYNLCDGGSTCKGAKRSEEFKRHLSEINKGKKLSEEHRRKISESNKGRRLTEKQREHLSIINKGKKLPPEQIEKLRCIAKTRVRTPEEIEKISSAHLGKKLTEEHKMKLSEAHKGKPAHNRKVVICIETNNEYFSAREAGRINNLNSKNISSCCRGERNVCGGFHWKYKEHQPEEPEELIE